MKHVDLNKKDPASGYNNQYLTKLVQNYRSHPAILRIPNRLFYDNELEIKGNPDIINMALGWEVLPNPQFPLIFAPGPERSEVCCQAGLVRPCLQLNLTSAVLYIRRLPRCLCDRHRSENLE
ncbi:Helicase MOV-10 [Homalodisca vitripennis]|nr:Helicase MOV-10 [Homalodisca vitripennis]